MRNFIKVNIDNVKGNRAVSIDHTSPKMKQKSRLKQQSSTNPQSINNRLSDVEFKLANAQQNRSQEIIEQLAAIKSDIRLIKSHLFENKGSFNMGNSKVRQLTHESQLEQEFQLSRLRVQIQTSQNNDFKGKKTTTGSTVDDFLSGKIKSHSNYQRASILVKSIYPMLKDYKLEGPERGNIFSGYSKKTSQAVMVKYSEESLSGIVEIYDKLWKNMAKSKWPCINKILDFRDDDFAVMVMEKNKGTISGLEAKNVLLDMLCIIEFVHECGYLYRNIEPEHFMINESGQLVVIDFKRAKRYVDIKGNQMDVVGSHSGSIFASNNQLRGLAEARKDDLESLAYLALLMLGLPIPWLGANRQQTIKIRSGMTLQGLFPGQQQWVEYMAAVMKSKSHQRPDYKRLSEILEQS